MQHDMMTRYLALGLVACTAWMAAHAQQSLADLVSEANADWMLGKWEAQTNDGNTVTLAFSWDLNKHVVVQQGKIGDMEFKGYTALDPNTSEPKYVGFDSRGSVSKGTWGVESGELTLRLEGQSRERGSYKMAVVYGGNATAGLKLRIHQVDQWGGLVSPESTALTFKKQK